MALLLTACGGGGAGSTDNANAATAATAATQQDATTTLYGTVVNRSTGKPVAQAVVSSGGISVVAGADGSYMLSGLPLGRNVVRVQATDHTAGTFVAETSAFQGRRSMQLALQSIGYSAAFSPTVAQQLTDPATQAQVSLPASALVKADGSAPTGQVTLSLTRIDPGADPSAMPGGFETANGPLQSFGAVDITFRDAVGQVLQLATGKTATIRIPLASGVTAPLATSPLYWLDEATGRWVREGSGTLVTVAGKSFYEGTVSHFTVWNADDLLQTVMLNGVVRDENGRALAGVAVRSTGVDYVGQSEVLTGADGSFRIPVRRDGRASLVATWNLLSPSAVPVGPYASDTTLSKDLVLFSLALARIVLGTPTSSSITNASNASPCCEQKEVRIPFETSGVDVKAFAGSNVVTDVEAFWELSYSFDMLPIPYPCSSGPGLCEYDSMGRLVTTAPAPEAFINWYSTPAATGSGVSIRASRVDVGGSARTGTLFYMASVHYGAFFPDHSFPIAKAVSITAVLRMDVVDPVTGTTTAIRSQPQTIRISLP